MSRRPSNSPSSPSSAEINTRAFTSAPPCFRRSSWTSSGSLAHRARTSPKSKRHRLTANSPVSDRSATRGPPRLLHFRGGRGRPGSCQTAFHTTVIRLIQASHPHPGLPGPGVTGARGNQRQHFVVIPTQLAGFLCVSGVAYGILFHSVSGTRVIKSTGTGTCRVARSRRSMYELSSDWAYRRVAFASSLRAAVDEPVPDITSGRPVN